MSNDIIEIGENQLDFKTLQELYNDLTGKTEANSIQLDYAVTVRMSDLEQVNYTIKQCAVSHGAILNNCSVTVFHSNKSKEQFSSFDRFKLYNKGNSSPIENIYLEYNYLIRNASSGKAAAYKIGLHTSSTLAIAEGENRLPISSMRIRRFFSLSPIRCKVNFVDYVVGRSFLQAVQEWADGLDRKMDNKVVETAQKHSHWANPIFAFGSTALFLYFSGAAFARSSIDTLTGLASQLLYVTAAGLLVWLLGSFLGRIVELGIDRFQNFSIILLNKGDDRCHSKFSKNNRTAAIQSVLGIGSVVGLNILSNYLSKLLFSA
ncbi:hypothetical protein [Celeribacter litoreus]|uniref:hypothetical protein n=1 Tax=Celeribacter litoreus TaxID=2876714 RepID=UPI001CC9A854|nr:hypothetical protein [Celeribacter litoreus]MCA0042818.1 hypothetical protein [Celeribacter litoreus]